MASILDKALKIIDDGAESGGVQLRVGYDAANYMDVKVSAAGAVTFTGAGTGSAFTFAKAVTVTVGAGEVFRADAAGGAARIVANQTGVTLGGTVTLLGNTVTSTAAATFTLSTNSSVMSFMIDADNNEGGAFFRWEHNGGSELMRLVEAGHLVLRDAAASPWHSSYVALQFTKDAIFANRGGTFSEIGVLGNAYFDTAFRYKGAGAASAIQQYEGTIMLRVASSGIAGTLINGTGAWTDALVITNAGVNQPFRVHIAGGQTVGIPGLAATGDPDTGLYWASGDVISMVAGGVEFLRCTNGATDAVNLLTGIHLAVEPTSRVFFDGGADTYILEGSADQIEVIAGNRARLLVGGLGTGVPATDQGAVSVEFNLGGTTAIRRLQVGAADSGGAGFRTVRVAN